MTLHKKNHITRTLLAVSMLAMSGGALAAQVPPGTQLAEKQELVRNNGSEPASLDPHKVESDVEFNIISDLFEGLVNVSPAGAIQPRLAERWENKDNLLWTFHLRPGLTWSDGTAITAQDIVWIEGYLLEPSGFNAAGEPVALNFATGELDTRQLRHPDGVILDIGTHVLAMLRETLLGCRGDVTLDLAVRVVKDRLGRDIAHGDMVTAEGEAHLQGRLGDIPLNIWLNKYAGPAGGQKGMRIGLRDGRMLALDRAPDGEVATLQDGERIQRWTRPGAIYSHCLDEQILGAENVFTRAPESVAGLTRRRLEEVEWLLRLQQQLRGPH